MPGGCRPSRSIQEIRQWFDGPLALSGSIATGGAVLAAQAMGADLAYIGSPFIATEEANADAGYKQGIVEGRAADIVYSNLFTGVHGNYLRGSIEAAGMDPDNLPEGDLKTMDFGGGNGSQGQGVEGHLGIGPGHRRGRPRSSRSRARRPAGARVSRAREGGWRRLALDAGLREQRRG